MGIESERKFLVDGDAWRDSAAGSRRMAQFYLFAEPGASVRVRMGETGDAVLTMKFGAAGRDRHEFELPLPRSEAEALRPFARGRVVEKTRHFVRHGGRLYEVDVFEGGLAGLVLAELETADAVATDELPPWVGREVTDDGRYYNASLALNGRPA